MKIFNFLKNQKEIHPVILRNTFVFKYLICLLFVFNFLCVDYTIAKGEELGGFEIKGNVENFSSGDLVTFELRSFKIDLTKSDITWILNNKNILSGFAENKITITIPNTESNLVAKVTNSLGETYTNNIRLFNKDLIIYWEAVDSYIPSWYEGKRLLTKGSDIRINAFQNIYSGNSKIKDEDIFFKWEINDDIDKDRSGYGKSFVDLHIPEGSRNYLDVKITATPKFSNEIIISTKKINLNRTKTLFYLKENNTNNLLALENKYKSKNTDFTLIAEPYFFSLDNDFNYYWKINGKEVKGEKERSFKIQNNTKSNIKIKIEHLKKIFQEAESELTVNF